MEEKPDFYFDDDIKHGQHAKTAYLD